MKICQVHWTMLRKQIENLGLFHLVAKTQDEMLEIVDHSLDGTHFTETCFDPLLMANYIIWQHAKTDYEKPFCPLCELEQEGGNVSERISHASNEALKEARRFNLVPSLQ